MNQISDKDPSNPHSSQNLRKKIVKELKIYDELIGKNKQLAPVRPFKSPEAESRGTQHLFHLVVCYHYKLPQESRDNLLKANKSDPDILRGFPQVGQRKSSAPGLLNARHPFAGRTIKGNHLASEGKLDHTHLQSDLSPIIETSPGSLLSH